MCRVERLEFLGCTIQGIRIVWSDTAYEDLKQRLRGFTSQRWRVSMEHRIARLIQYLRGWMGYFGISQRYEQVPQLDVLLETVAQTANPHRPPAQIGDFSASCFCNGAEP